MAGEELQKVPGIGSATAMKMVDAGYKSIESVAGADANRLAEATGIGLAVAEKIIDAAKEQLSGLKKKPTAAGEKKVTYLTEGPKDMITDLIDKVSDKLVGLDSDYSIDLNDVGMGIEGRNLSLGGNIGLRVRRSLR